MHAYEMHAHETHTHEMQAYKMQAHEVHAYNMHAHKMYAHEMHAYDRRASTRELWIIPTMCEVTPHANSPSPELALEFAPLIHPGILGETGISLRCTKYFSASIVPGGPLRIPIFFFSSHSSLGDYRCCRFLWKDALGVGCRIRHVLSTEHSRTFVLLNHVRVFHYRYFVGLTPVSRANFQRLIHHLPKL
jgi:hypothetical protein